MQQVRAGLNYQFGADAATANAWPILTKAQAAPDLDLVNFHGQATFVWQGYPAIRSPYQGPNSLPGGGQGRETADASLYAGIRLWQGAELWINPDIDQGFGLANTHGVALPECGSLQARRRLSLCPRVTRLRAPDHRSRR